MRQDKEFLELVRMKQANKLATFTRVIDNLVNNGFILFGTEYYRCRAG